MFHGKRVCGGPSFLFKTRGGLVIFPVRYDGGEGSGWMMWWLVKYMKTPIQIVVEILDQMHSNFILFQATFLILRLVNEKIFFSSQRTRFNTPPPQKASNHQGNTLENTHISPVKLRFRCPPLAAVRIRPWLNNEAPMSWCWLDLAARNFPQQNPKTSEFEKVRRHS